MTQPDLLSWREAESKAADGISRSVDHADRKEPNWSDRALEILASYARCCPGQFMAEDVRDNSDRAGLPKPPDPRAWGAVFQRARKSGLIEMVGYAPAKSSNCSPKTLWSAVK